MAHPKHILGAGLLRYPPLRVTVLLFFMLAGFGTAQAFQIPTGNDDLRMSWDNTILYNLGMRVEHQQSKIKNTHGYYESDSKFSQGDIEKNRISLTSQFELVYKSKYGLFVSGDAWYDAAYSNTHVKTQPGYPNSSYYNNTYSSYTRRYYRGPSAEFLDAFVFGSFQVGNVPINTKVGRLTEEWGPGLLLSAQEISVNQEPTDLRKALADPGSKVSELFLPVAQVDLQASLTNNFSVSAQYFFEYEASRYPEGGTYFGGPDYLFKGPNRYYPAPAAAPLHNAGEYKPGNTDPAQYGVMAHWSPNWTNATIGFYYRRYNNKQAWVQFGAPAANAYRTVFPTGTNLYGLSLDRNIGPFAFGAELSYLQRAALINTGQLSANGRGPRGNVWNVDFNTLLTTASTPLFDTSTLLAELGYQHLDSVTERSQYYDGVGYAGCTNPATGASGTRWDGCGTKNSLQAAVDFTPEWMQVFPEWNFYLPLTVIYTIYGNGVTLPAQVNGVNQGAVNYSAGVKAEYRNKYTATLSYADSFARYHAYNGVVADGNGPWATNDRGRVTLTLKTEF